MDVRSQGEWRRGLWIERRAGMASGRGQEILYDLHATILHLRGIDHEKLTDIHGHVIKAVLA